MENRDMNYINLLIDDGMLVKHHTSTSRGYVPSGMYIVDDYKGRFGSGFKVLEHNPQSRRYCLVTYYIFVGEMDD